MDGDSTLIPVAPDNPHPLGRHLNHDPRNRDHRAFAVTPQRPDKWSLWYTTDVYDQASDNCTTEAAIGLCRTSPARFRFTANSWKQFDTEPERVAAYQSWQRYDPASWGPHAGSASDSPYKGLRDAGHISGWKWLFGYDEVKQWVMYDGACTVGTVWLQSMFTTTWVTPPGLRPGCYFVVLQGSPVVGGHEWRVLGYSPGRQAFRMVNSWGTGWGDGGRAWILAADLAWLLEQQGDAVTIV